MSLNINSRWKAVAKKHYGLTTGGWSLLPDCPCPNLAKLRDAVDGGEYFMAQRRVGPRTFELLITRPVRSIRHV